MRWCHRRPRTSRTWEGVRILGVTQAERDGDAYGCSDIATLSNSWKASRYSSICSLVKLLEKLLDMLCVELEMGGWEDDDVLCTLTVCCFPLAYVIHVLRRMFHLGLQRIEAQKHTHFKMFESTGKQSPQWPFGISTHFTWTVSN